MYTYSDFTVLIALNYTNKAQTEKNKNKKTKTKKQKQKNKKNHKKTERRDRTKFCPPLSATTVTEIAKLELGTEAIHSIALRPNSVFSMILQEKKGWLLS